MDKPPALGECCRYERAVLSARDCGNTAAGEIKRSANGERSAGMITMAGRGVPGQRIDHILDGTDVHPIPVPCHAQALHLRWQGFCAIYVNPAAHQVGATRKGSGDIAQPVGRRAAVGVRTDESSLVQCRQKLEALVHCQPPG